MNDLRHLLKPPPGVRSHPLIERKLKAIYPEVRLVWDPTIFRWRMIERLADGSYDHIVDITDRDGRFAQPSIANTVNFLAMVDKYKQLRSEYDRQAFGRRLDATFDSEAQQQDWAARDRIDEGSRRLLERFDGRISVAPWQSGQTSNRSSKRSG